MSDAHRREKWFRGYRRLLKLDPAKTDALKREIEMAKQSKSYIGDLLCISVSNRISMKQIISFCRQLQATEFQLNKQAIFPN